MAPGFACRGLRRSRARHGNRHPTPTAGKAPATWREGHTILIGLFLFLSGAVTFPALRGSIAILRNLPDECHQTRRPNAAFCVLDATNSVNLYWGYLSCVTCAPP